MGVASAAGFPSPLPALHYGARGNEGSHTARAQALLSPAEGCHNPTSSVTGHSSLQMQGSRGAANSCQHWWAAAQPLSGEAAQQWQRCDQELCCWGNGHFPGTPLPVTHSCHREGSLEPWHTHGSMLEYSCTRGMEGIGWQTNKQKLEIIIYSQHALSMKKLF